MSPTLEDLSLSPLAAALQLQAETTSKAPPAAQRTGRPKSKEEAEALLLRHSLQDSAGAQSGTTNAKNNPLFGSRLLREGDDPMSHNAWDHVEPPPEYQAMVDSLLATQAETKVPTEKADELYHAQPASHWDAFYAQHENRFFKRRAWLGNEFPELMALLESEQPDNVDGTSSKSKGVFEIGCGNGSSVFPLLEQNANPDLTVYACDYSKEAVQVVRSNELYQNPPIGKARAFVWDVSSPAGPPVDEIPEGSLDVIVLIFVLSALHPREWKQAVRNIHRLLKPGGLLLFRDYARYDLPQLRFRKGRMLDDNFYARGDGTRVYFFTPEELVEIFQTGPPPGTSAAVDGDHASAESQQSSDLLFDTLQLATDRRMLVNRKENKQMYRCWLQGKFRKR